MLPSSCRQFTLAVLALLASLCLTACQPPPTEIRVAVNPWPGYGPIYLAEALGLFEARNLNVRLLHQFSNGDARRALERQQADIATSTSLDLLTIHQNGALNPRFFYYMDFSNGSDVIITHRTIQSLGQLQGKRVAAEPGSLDMAHLHAALWAEQISPSAVTIVGLPQGKMVEAMQQGKVDAVVTYPPVSSTLLRNPDLHVVFDSSRIPGVIIDGLIANESFLSTHPEEIAGFLAAVEEAADYAARYPAETCRLIAPSLQLTPEETCESLQGIRTVRLAEQQQWFDDTETFAFSLLASWKALYFHDGIYSEAPDFHQLAARFRDASFIKTTASRETARDAFTHHSQN